MTKPQVNDVKALVAWVASFYPAVDVGPETISAYEAKMRGLNWGAVSRVLEEWVDKNDHWPAWSELRPLLRKRVPRSLSEQNPPEWQRELGECKTPDEAKAILNRYAERARSRSGSGEEQ